MHWVQAALPSLSGEHISLDGKPLRGSRVGDRTVHWLSAYAAKARRVFTQQAVGEETNEITAIPDLLSMLDMTGALVSVTRWAVKKRTAKTINCCESRLSSGAEEQSQEVVQRRQAVAR